jgi:hypothetical protein
MIDGVFRPMVLNNDERKVLEHLILSKLVLLTEVSQAYKLKKSKGHLISDSIEKKMMVCEQESNILGGLLQKLS